MGAEDAPSCSEQEKEAKRQRSASTTPRSTMGTLPYEYDRVMGAASVGSQESVRFGEENDPETEDVQDTVAHSPEDLDQTYEEEGTYHDANPGIGEFHGGFGSASLRECLGRVVQPTTTTSATCHSGEGVGDSTSRMTDLLVSGSWPLRGSSAPMCEAEKSICQHDTPCLGLEFYASRLNHLCQGSVPASALHKSYPGLLWRNKFSLVL